jgi:hypothetical protein
MAVGAVGILSADKSITIPAAANAPITCTIMYGIASAIDILPRNNTAYVTAGL